MLSLLHSFYRPTCLILCVLLGLACGHLADTILLMKLRPTFTDETGPERPSAIASVKTPAADLDLILQNNIFDAGNRSAAASMSREAKATGSSEDSSNTVRADIKLFGTVVAGDLSQALLEINKQLKLYHLGDKVPGGGTIEEVQRNRVVIKNRDGSQTTLVLFEKSPVAGSKPANGPVPGPGADDVVRSVGENRWMISRKTVESVRENFADQLRLAQMQPRTVNGKTDGFLVQRINPRSLLAKLGIQRGDVVIDVNNIKLNSPEKALQIFQQLREARQISVSLERNGQPMSFAYEIE